MASDPLAQERDAKFKIWLQNKALRDKAFEYLARLDSSRAQEEESLIETAICLRAIDKLLGNEDGAKKSPQPAEGEYVPPKDQSGAAKKTLKSAWFRWTMEHYAFSMIHLTEADIDSLSGAVKEFLFSESDIIASGGNYGEELERASRVKNILPSLKYFFPQVPKPNEKAKPLTNDQKAQNAIYMREAKKLWRKAGEELNNRVVEYVARAMRSGGSAKGKRRGSAQEQQEEEGEAKGKMEDEDDFRGPSRGGGAGDKLESPEERMQRAKRLEARCLEELSMKRLKAWLEEDDDKRANKANEDAMEKLKLAKQSHEQFVKKKDGLRIRMPENVTAPVIPSMGYGREMSGVRAQVKGVQTTVELMAGMGLKYVHATNKGRKGQMGDLEKSREQLLKMGFVDKANFDADEMDRYERERRENSVIKERQEIEAKQREETARAYEEWVVQKELRDSALKCLALVPKPVAELAVAHDDPRGSATSLRRSQQNTTATTVAPSNPMQNPALARHCMDIGRAMKKVDRTTFLDWAKWCEGVFSINTAMVLWDSFAPVACDVHCASYSQVRDTFLKLLRPGVDYRETFLEYVEKHIFARRIAKFKDEKEYYHLRDDAKQELDEEIESMRKEWLSDVALSKEDMRKLLLQMGIALKETEMRALIDAFDANSDGVITIAEFLEFTGPKRDKRSGNSVVMSQRCCWLTTCRVTGMPGAYSVSAPTKRALRAEESKHGDGDEAAAKQAHSTTLGRVDMVIRKLANGESRVCIELRERKKREELLRKMGLLDGSGERTTAAGGKRTKGSKRDEGKSGAGDGEGEYESDFADHDEDYGNDFEGDEEDGAGKGGTKAGKGKTGTLSSTAAAANACQYSTWSTEDRKEGLKFLLEVTRDARQEQTLKQLLEKGVPPAPPKMWMKNEHFLETKSLNRRSVGSIGSLKNVGSGVGGGSGGGKKVAEGKHDDAEEGDGDEPDLNPECTEVTIHWGPQNKGDLVSFYSLEFGGVVGATKTTDVKYTEIFRDPPDSDPSRNFDFCYTMTDLTPGASYRFRLRAFNGFGPGDYTYKTFTTVTAAPAQPRVIKVASDCVWLKWTFSAGFFRRLDELRRIFNLADSDHSGMVSREELTALLDERASSSPELRAFLNKVAAGLGLVVTQGYDALFDMIEGDDDGGLSWSEFEGFFMAAGWGNAPSVAGPAGTANFSTGALQSTLRTGAGPAAAGITISPGDINYVVERCESEADDRYVEVLRTTLGNGMVNRLEPGKSYRFRVYSLNADGVASARSPPVLVHTLVETPQAPVAPPKLILAKKVTLTWKARNIFTGARSKAFTDKMLGEWAGDLGNDEGGVSVRAAFDRYDRDGSGDIDASELASILQDLGVDASEERLNEAFAILDRNKDGVISYEEFAKWWRRDGVSYTLKRSEEVLPLNSALYTALDNGTNRFRTAGSTFSQLLGAATGAAPTAERATSRGRGAVAMSAIAEEPSQTSRSRPASAGAAAAAGTGDAAAVTASAANQRQVAVPIVVYRGDKTRCDVMGLTPNRLYHFKVRYVGSRSNSILSPPLLLMTAPLPTSCPVLVDLTHNTVRAKWYPSQYGAFKFAVHMRLAEAAQPATNNFSATNAHTTTTATNAAARKVSTGLVGAETGEEGWIAVYNGLDNVFTATSLASNTAYQLRVFALNCQGIASEPSETITFTTLQRSESTGLTPKNAGSKFTIECTGDICVGDVILITERLFLKHRPASATLPPSAASAPSAAGSVRNSQTSVAGLPPKGGKGKGGKDAAGPVAAAKTGAILPNMSVTSLNGAGLDAASITPSRGEYLGERTIAAYVARDNYRTIRDALSAAGVEPKQHKKFGPHRKLWLEVVWERTSDEACKPYDLKSGEVLERMQSHLEQFEVFRCAWREENKRKPLQEEWKAMSECFIQTDC